VGNQFDQFVLGDPILKRTTQVKGQLFGAVHGYQSAYRDNASVALGQPLALPNIAEQNLFGQIDQLRRNIAYPIPYIWERFVIRHRFSGHPLSNRALKQATTSDCIIIKTSAKTQHRCLAAP
jgi:hypothetical protein